MATIVTFLITILVGLVTAEILAYASHIAKWFVARSVLELAEADRERYLEEWLAHVEELPGSLTKILHGLDCWLRVARRVARLKNQKPTVLQLAILDAKCALIRGGLWLWFAPRAFKMASKFLVERQTWKTTLMLKATGVLIETFVHHRVRLGEDNAQVMATIDTQKDKIATILRELRDKLLANAKAREAKSKSTASQQ
jgi:hypothetical protein